jgi:hypothetical protein
MTKIGDRTYFATNDGSPVVPIRLKTASPEHVLRVIMQNEDDPDGRSEWLWVTLPNGDVILGTFPQGTTYEASEVDFEYGI